MPCLIRSRIGSRRSNVRVSLSIVVDSPPGTTSASTSASSVGRRTGRADDVALGEGGEVLAYVALQGEHADDGVVAGGHAGSA